MKTSNLILIVSITIILFCVFIAPEASAQYVGGSFESKISGLSSALITQILPLLSIIGLFYASALAMNGSPEAKGKIITIISCSVVGFLAPYIINWLKSFAA